MPETVRVLKQVADICARIDGSVGPCWRSSRLGLSPLRRALYPTSRTALGRVHAQETKSNNHLRASIYDFQDLGELFQLLGLALPLKIIAGPVAGTGPCSSELSSEATDRRRWVGEAAQNPVQCECHELMHYPGLVASSQRKEFELVKQALYTDPDDQSAWIYHRWLIGQSK